ncbi:MAG TPA: hypothetical protein VE464_22220 [Streptosporangiaceae bacterium]|nr:hypothetical protein [Streptosporangiaceae bacterium]
MARLVGQPMEMLVPDAMRDAHLGHRAGDEADPQPRPLGAGRQLAGCRRDASTFPARVSLSTIDEEGRDHAGRIVEASEQVATLIDDLLRLSRLSPDLGHDLTVSGITGF